MSNAQYANAKLNNGDNDTPNCNITPWSVHVVTLPILFPHTSGS